MKGWEKEVTLGWGPLSQEGGEAWEHWGLGYVARGDSWGWGGEWGRFPSPARNGVVQLLRLRERV